MEKGVSSEDFGGQPTVYYVPTLFSGDGFSREDDYKSKGSVV
jgi:hypothetical protein